MHLRHDIHLAYCTNIHRGETWPEVFRNLETHVLAVRERVASGRLYGIGLRLGNGAAVELAERATLDGFRRWLDRHGCYVFTINGFPYGRFHDARVKEQVYVPDWTAPERVNYTLRLLDILSGLLPEGVEGSVSTVPGSFKEFIRTEAQVEAMVRHLWSCVDHLARVRERTGRVLHLDLEPEPLCYLETSEETARFFDRLRAHRPGDSRLEVHLRVNYDTCHLAVEFEEPGDALRRLRDHGVRVGKFHFSSALSVNPTPQVRTELASFTDDVYLHQVVVRNPDGHLQRFKDLPVALAVSGDRSVFGVTNRPSLAGEWRIHYHIPLHSPPAGSFGTTQGHLLGVMDALGRDPSWCSHLEMETYTWEVLPPELKERDVVDQLVAEYVWTLARLKERGLADNLLP